MARPEHFEPQKKLLSDHDATARTLPKRKTIIAYDKDQVLGSYGVTKAIESGNNHLVQKYLDIRDNKNKANTFLRGERLNREKDAKILAKQRMTG